jgi:uncharacterized protein (TIGR03435 family)
MQTTVRLPILAILAVAASAQTANAPLAFEVASARQHEGPRTRTMVYSASGTRLTLGAYAVAHLIHEAFDREFYEIVVPPSIPDDIYYDIVAKAPGDQPRSRDDFRRMLQTLLADRFNLRFHREFRDMAVHILVVGKGGPKFKQSAPGAVRQGRGGRNGRNQVLTATHYTMVDLARALHNFLGAADRPVIDRTGLPGGYDFRIEAAYIGEAPAFDDLSPHTAVKEQLGLELVPRRAQIEVLVVDRFDKPSAN